jgi:hypothetical protein
VTHQALAAELTRLLREIDATVRARFEDAGRGDATRRRPEARERRGALRGVAAATLRWLARSRARGPISRAPSSARRPR